MLLEAGPGTRRPGDPFAEEVSTLQWVPVATRSLRDDRVSTNDKRGSQASGDEIGVDWSRFDLEQFRFGLDVEYEHGSHDPQTDVTHDDPVMTGKIALAHMKEFPDY